MVLPEFMIPLKKQDLLKGGSDNYFVKDVIEFSDCLNNLSAFKKGLKNVGCDAILQNFDLAFSFLYDFNEPSFNDLQKFYDEILSEILERIVNYTENAMSLDTVGKMQATNVIKMTFYIFSLFLKTYEEKISYNNDNFISEPKRKKGTKNAVSARNNYNDESWLWNEKKKEAISVIYSFLQLPISNIWQKPVIEDAFINLLGNCCYRSLESPDINLIKWKPLRDSVAQVLGLLVSKHNHGLTFVPRVVQLMKQYEHAAAALSSATLIIVNDYGCPTLLSKMIKELFEVVQDDPQILGKAAGVFITDLAENDPTVFTSSIKHLSSFLNIDAYPVRNSILTTFTEMILKSFSGEDLSNQLKKDRDFILTKMQQHMHDENAYVRSKVLQLWTKLASAFCIPKDMYTKLMGDANHRLMDKSTYVSKNAINFFTNALVYNPFSGRFQLSELNAKLQKEKNDLKLLLNSKPLPPEEVWKLIEIKLILAISEVLKDGELPNEETIDNNDSVEITDVMLVISKLVKDELFTQALSLLKMSEKLYPDCTEIRCNVESNDKVEYYVTVLKKIFLVTAKSSPKVLVPEYYENSQKIIAQTEMIKYTEGSIKFLEAIQEALLTIETLMFSNGTPEVLEAIDFFSNAYKFKIEGSEKAVRNMLRLVKSTKPELKEAVGKAYRSLYLETSKTTSKAKALQVSRRLIKLVRELDESQKSSLEDILHSWINSNELDKEFIMVLLDKISSNNTSDNSECDLTACLILLDMISRVNSSLVPANYMLFKNLFTNNLEMSAVKYLCSLLMRPVEKIDGKIVKYHKDYELFQTGVQIVIDNFDNFNASDYINLATSVVDMIFQLCFHPEEISNELLLKLYLKMKEHTKDDENKDSMERFNELLLGRLIFLCAHITFRKYQYCDKDVFNALKRCMNGVVLPEEAKKDEEDYLDISADNEVAADDALYEEILKICDGHFFKEGSLTDQIKTVIVNICKNFKDPSLSAELKAAAAISLSKLMMVSQSVCEEMFSLYMTVMDKSDNDIVKSNLIIAFGDLLCRFPNIAEPWTSYLYSRMVDSSASVRKSAASILCYLISREMIKVRGHIADLVIHLEDMEAEISEKVRCLLLDLSRKGNTLYNVIPDIISNLSNPERKDPVSSSTFKAVIGHIFSLVTKEKQNDLLVEKLCLRLKESTCERQSEDIVFCLSQIFYSEKSLRKLTDYLPGLVEKFAHPPILTTVQSIISTCSKSTKPNIKELAVEASSKLEELMTVKDNDKTVVKNRESDSPKRDSNDKTPIKSPNSNDPPKSVRTRRTTAKKKPKPSQTPQRSSRRKKIQKQFLSDSEEDE